MPRSFLDTPCSVEHLSVLGVPAVQPTDFSHWGPVEREPLRSIRRQIARHMQLTWAEGPHVNHQDACDVTEPAVLRQGLAPKIKGRGGRSTLSVLVMKAVAATPRAFPRFDASLDCDGEELVIKRYFHIAERTRCGEVNHLGSILEDPETFTASI